MNTKGKLIVIDGLDGCGKHTQSELLFNELRDMDLNVSPVDFPRYRSESSHMVREYLNGTFCDDPEDMDPYTASMFYSIDRSISYKIQSWGKKYNIGYTIISDRYTPSNVIHQGSKLSTDSEFEKFIDWLFITEIERMGIPCPDLVIFFEISKMVQIKTLRERAETDSNHKSDIHELNMNYMDKCRDTLQRYKKYALGKEPLYYFHYKPSMHHVFIKVDDGKNMRSREDIHKDVMDAVKRYHII